MKKVTSSPGDEMTNNQENSETKNRFEETMVSKGNLSF